MVASDCGTWQLAELLANSLDIQRTCSQLLFQLMTGRLLPEALISRSRSGILAPNVNILSTRLSTQTPCPALDSTMQRSLPSASLPLGIRPSRCGIICIWRSCTPLPATRLRLPLLTSSKTQHTSHLDPATAWSWSGTLSMESGSLRATVTLQLTASYSPRNCTGSLLERKWALRSLTCHLTSSSRTTSLLPRWRPTKFLQRSLLPANPWPGASLEHTSLLDGATTTSVFTKSRTVVLARPMLSELECSKSDMRTEASNQKTVLYRSSRATCLPRGLPYRSVKVLTIISLFHFLYHH